MVAVTMPSNQSCGKGLLFALLLGLGACAHSPEPESGVARQSVPGVMVRLRPPEAEFVNANAGNEGPYGTPVPGKPGFVTSPYAPDTPPIDVHGVATGAEFKDPYTGHVFLVPPRKGE